MKGLITIEINNLRLFGKHGLYEEEQKLGAEFELDVCLDYVAPEEVITSIKETINYVVVYDIVKEEMNNSKPLLETVVMTITQRLYEKFPLVKKISITLKKLSPPITQFRGSVAVRYFKEF